MNKKPIILEFYTVKSGFFVHPPETVEVFSSDLALKRVFLAKKKQVTMAEKLSIETKKINNAVLVGSTTIIVHVVLYGTVLCIVRYYRFSTSDTKMITISKNRFEKILDGTAERARVARTAARPALVVWLAR